MKWSVQVAKLAGTPIRVHASFLLIVAWVAFAQHQQDPQARAVGLSVLFVLGIRGARRAPDGGEDAESESVPSESHLVAPGVRGAQG